jgi:hypothetical protein
MENFPKVSLYDFKAKISSYIRMLERGDCKGIILCRHKEPIAMIGALKPQVRSDFIL